MSIADRSSPKPARGRRRRSLLVLAVAALVVVPAAISWACGPNRAIQLDRISYTPGQTVNVSGANFDVGASVDINVDGVGVTSTTVSGTGNISASFPAPSALGTHTVNTSGTDQNGQALAGTGNSVTFTVVAPSSSGGGGNPSSPGSSAGSGSGSGSSTPGTTSGRTGSGAGDNSRSVPGGERFGRAGGGGGGGGGANAGVNTTEGVIDTAGTTAFAGSVPRTTRAEVAARVTGDRGAASGARPSERSAAADLWSGLSSSNNPSLMSEADEPGDAGTGAGLVWALALLGAGALALLGLGAAEAQRRRKVPTR